MRIKFLGKIDHLKQSTGTRLYLQCCKGWLIVYHQASKFKFFIYKDRLARLSPELRTTTWYRTLPKVLSRWNYNIFAEVPEVVVFLVRTLQCLFLQPKPTDKQQPPSNKLSKKRSCDEVWNICEAVKKCLFVFCNLFIEVFGALGNVICSRVICAHLVWEEICQEWGGINTRLKPFD